jgi:hypothetical protein
VLLGSTSGVGLIGTLHVILRDPLDTGTNRTLLEMEAQQSPTGPTARSRCDRPGYGRARHAPNLWPRRPASSGTSSAPIEHRITWVSFVHREYRSTSPQRMDGFSESFRPDFNLLACDVRSPRQSCPHSVDNSVDRLRMLL